MHNPSYYQIIKNVAERTNIPEHKVRAALFHTCRWIKHGIMDLKYDQIRWTKLGTFTRLDIINREIKIENDKTTSSKIAQSETSNE